MNAPKTAQEVTAGIQRIKSAFTKLLAPPQPQGKNDKCMQDSK
jgi:hypothetical protein